MNLRPASYKDAALTAELRASSWVGGIRTHTSLIKSQVCSRYTTEPVVAWVHRFTSQNPRHIRAPSGSSALMQQQVVALRIELSLTALSGPSGQPVLDYRTTTTNCARTLSAVGIETQLAVSASSRSASHASASSSGSVLDKCTQPKKKARRRYDTGPDGSPKSRTRCHFRLLLLLSGA